MTTCQLDNGLEVFSLNRHETEFMYREIFEDELYLRHGVEIPPSGAVVIDIGANVGMFSLFVRSRCPDARIAAFEPAPEVFGILSLNLEKCGPSVACHQAGVSSRPGEARFVYYPNYSIMSGLNSDIEKDREILAAGILNDFKRTRMNLNDSMRRKISRKSAEDKLKDAVEIDCPLVTVSDAIDDLGIGPSDLVDLLKIDAEGAELDILAGIRDTDWPRIRQVVMEVHGEAEAEAIVEKLAGLGFTVNIEQDAQFDESPVRNVYAVRASSRGD